MIAAWSILLTLLANLTVIGPAHLSYAGDGTLEAVAQRRLDNGWNLTHDWRDYPVLVAPADCDLLDRTGWLVVGGQVTRALVVDCESDIDRGTLQRQKLLADVNLRHLTHQKGLLVLNNGE